MRHQYLRLGLILIVLSASSACSIKEPPLLGEKCPPSGGEIAYILDSEGNRCEPGQPCFEDVSEYGRCPSDYRCSYDGGRYYCYKGCGADQIRCGDTCINPKNSDTNCGATGFCYEDEPGDNFRGMNCGLSAKCSEGVCLCSFDGTSNNHCGAKGLCNEADPSSENYRGMDCGSKASCDSGSCKCSFDGSGTLHCGAKGNCADPNPGSDNYEGMYCGENSICDSGKCKCEDDYEQCGGTDYSLCVDIKTDINHCGGCNIKCKDGECVDGHCIKNNCEPNTCSRDECRNDNDRCGESCADCTSASKVCDIEMGSCQGCNANETYNPTVRKCVPNDVLNCGGVNCLDDNLIWNTISCQEDQCKVTCNNIEDSDGNHYHVNATGDRCEKDTDVACGSLDNDCTKKDSDGNYIDDARAESRACVKGKCVSTECKLSEEATFMYYDYDELGHYKETYVALDSEQEFNWYSSKGGALGYYRHTFAPDYKTGKCIEADKTGFCGKNRLDCHASADSCVGKAPGCRCVGGQWKCGECDTLEKATSNSYCALIYSCGCPKGQHRVDYESCGFDGDDNCGAEGINCADFCAGISGCETASCRDGRCVITKCKKNGFVCGNSCVSSEALCIPTIESGSAVMLDCGGGGIYDPSIPDPFVP